MHDARATRIGQKLRAVAEQPTGRDAIQYAHESLTGILHLDHLTATWTELLDHDTEKVFGDVDRKLLVRLELLAVHPRLQDHARTRDLKLVPFATHRLDENRKMQLAASAHRPGVRRLRV